MDAGGQPPYEHGKWSDERQRIVSDKNINPVYENRIIFYKSNATLCITEVSGNDSGIYTFSYEKNFAHINKRYKLIVEDAVPKPALSLRLEQFNTSIGLCNFTVNCSIDSDWLWTECDQDGCEKTHKSFAQHNITVSADDRRVTCTGNNHVSSQEDSQDFPELCFSSEHPEAPTSDDLFNVKILVLIIIWVVIFVFAFFVAKTILLPRRTKQPQVIQSQPLEQQPRISTSSTLPEASYENVDPENPEANVAETEPTEKPDTVYCVLQPFPESASAQRGGREAEDRDPEQIHTVYSVVKKPKV